MTSFTTPEQIDYFRLATLKSGLKLLAAGIKPNAQWTKTNALRAATGYTGKRYGRSQIAMAIADLQAIIDERVK